MARRSLPATAGADGRLGRVSTPASPARGPLSATGAIYGTILVTALVAGLSEDPDYSDEDILISVVATAIVFWLAHVYAHVLGDRLEGGTHRLRELVRTAAGAESPLVYAAVLPCAALVLGLAGAWSRNTSVTIAVWLGVASLAAYGFRFGRRLGHGIPTSTLSAVANAFAGVVIVILKIVIH
jgi:hypothetical protein